MVRVPVLSEQITVVQPSVSTAVMRLTMARCCAMAYMPSASVTVSTAGSPSGVAATASASEVSSICAHGSPRHRPSAKMIVTTMAAISTSLCASPSICFCSGVAPVSACANMVASRPISVCMPVPVTSSSARPRVTPVFMNAMLMRSPSAAAGGATKAASLPTACDSPVSADSSISTLCAASRRPSAGTRSPASSSTTSPGTIWLASISSTRPARRTRATGASMFLSAASVFSARYSCQKPSTALNITTTRITVTLFMSPMKAAITAATSNMRISMLLN